MQKKKIFWCELKFYTANLAVSHKEHLESTITPQKNKSVVHPLQNELQ